MIPYVRRKSILELLYNKEVVYLDEIVEHLDVSIATVRRDLRVLEEESKIDILQGGAARIKKNISERSLSEKVDLNKEEKEIIGDYSSTLVKNGDFIFIGPGTTEHWIIKSLVGKDVTVVTNGSYHIDELRRYSINTIVLGGEVNNKIAVIYGPTTIKQINDMSFDIAFIGASGFTLNQGPSTSDLNVSEVNKIAIQNSRKVYIILDSTKLGKTSRFIFSNNSDNEYKVITTKKAEKMYKDDNRFMVVN